MRLFYWKSHGMITINRGICNVHNTDLKNHVYPDLQCNMGNKEEWFGERTIQSEHYVPKGKSLGVSWKQNG